MQEPVSVVMPVRNALPHLDAAVSSILGQTHKELELVVGDDASTDGSAERLAWWARQDGRIRLHRSDTAQGPAGSSNWVARLASHRIVARMDADDVCGPDRLVAQLAVLAAAPDAVLVGTMADYIDAAGRRVRPARRSQLGRLGSQRSPFPHGSIMYRRDAFDRIGGYRAAADFWEDQDLYWRMADVGRLLILPDVHYSYRYNTGHARLAVETRRVELALDRYYRCLRARERGESHEAVLVGPNAVKLLPEAIRARASLQLLSGGRAAALGKLLRDGALGLDLGSIASVAMCAATTAAPRASRALLRAHAYVREVFSGVETGGAALEWRPDASAAMRSRGSAMTAAGSSGTSARVAVAARSPI